MIQDRQRQADPLFSQLFGRLAQASSKDDSANKLCVGIWDLIALHPANSVHTRFLNQGDRCFLRDPNGSNAATHIFKKLDCPIAERMQRIFSSLCGRKVSVSSTVGTLHFAISAGTRRCSHLSEIAKEIKSRQTEQTDDVPRSPIHPDEEAEANLYLAAQQQEPLELSRSSTSSQGSFSSLSSEGRKGQSVSLKLQGFYGDSHVLSRAFSLDGKSWFFHPAVPSTVLSVLEQEIHPLVTNIVSDGGKKTGFFWGKVAGLLYSLSHLHLWTLECDDCLSLFEKELLKQLGLSISPPSQKYSLVSEALSRTPPDFANWYIKERLGLKV